MADPRLVAMIVKAAKQTGADPRALLATTLQESGGRFGAVGDHGTSYGPYQFHEGGALGSHNAAWANSYAAVLNRAQEFKRLGVHGGTGAAAVQRPADRAGYASGVDAKLGQAGSILRSSNGNLKLPDGTVAKSVLPKPSQAAPNASPLLTPGETTTPTAGPLGGLTAGGFAQQAREQLGLKGTDPLAKLQSMIPADQGLPLPDGTTAKTQAGLPIKVTKDAQKAGIASPDGAGIVAAAKKYLGVPYQWGGESVKGMDCSGLVQLAVKNATGKSIPRVAADQYAASTKVSLKNMKPGDIIGFGTKSNLHHIGIYVGNGNYIQSPHTGDHVKISSLKDRNDIVGAGRF